MSAETVVTPEIAEATLEGPQGKLAFRLFKTSACFQIANDIFAGTTYPNVPFVTDVETIFDIGAAGLLRSGFHSGPRSNAGRGP